MLTDLERKVLSEVSKEKAWEHVKWFADVGEKLSGTPEFERSVDYVVGTLEGYGVEVAAPEYQSYLSVPNIFSAELRVTEPEIKVIDCISYTHIKSTPPEGVEGELVYVGQGGLEDYKGKSVRNKITLAELSYSPPRPWKNYLAGINGAAGQIQINWAGEGRRVFGRGTVKSVWGNPTPETIDDVGRIPVVGIMSDDGAYLKKLLQKGPVRVWLKAEAPREWMRSRQPIAAIKGTDPSFVLLGSHLDAWGGAVTCNATGCSSTLEVARVLNKNRQLLRRSIRFAWFQGHENGIMSGSTWYVDNFWEDLSRNCVAYFNNDSVGMVYQHVYMCGGDPILIDFLKSVISDLAEEEGASTQFPVAKYHPVKTGDQSFYGVGIPSCNARTTYTKEAGEKGISGLGWWYHSDQDTIDKADPEALHMANKAMTLVLLRLCTIPVLPYKVGQMSQWMLDTLDELNEKAKGSIDISSLVSKTRAFSEVATDLDTKIATLTKVWQSMESARGIVEETEAVNRAVVEICRVLSPINYTLKGRYDQDYYGAEYVRPMPVLQPVSELAPLNPDTGGYKALKTKLVRAKNMVSDAIDKATSIAAAALERLGT